MKKYLLDSNMCIFYLKGLFNLEQKFLEIGFENCFLSEITLAELKFGAESSDNPSKRKPIIQSFISKFDIVPIRNVLDLYAIEKTRLRKAGIIISEFDLLIGTTAVVYDMVMVTNNSAHLGRINDIVIEDWKI